MIAYKLMKIARLVNAFVGWLNDKKIWFLQISAETRLTVAPFQLSQLLAVT